MKTKKHERPRTLRSAFSELDTETPLGQMIYSTTEEWYRAKHSKASCDEISLVNSTPIADCPFCHSASFRKDGKRGDGIQRYRCSGCGRKFNPLTGTVFDSHKIPISEWIEFLIHLFQYESVTVSSLDNRNSQSTGRYWMKKVFEVVGHYQDGIMLGGKFWVDETYFSKTPSETSEDERGRKLRGLSRDKMCVAGATDGDKTVLYVTGLGKPTSSKIAKAIGPHVTAGSMMIDDKEPAHRRLSDAKRLKRVSYRASTLRGIPDKDNPMNEINTVHRLFKTFMSRHGSYDRPDLQSWCNLFSFILCHHGNVAEMVSDFLKLAISTRKVVRFRTAMKKNG